MFFDQKKFRELRALRDFVMKGYDDAESALAFVQALPGEDFEISRAHYADQLF